MLALPAALCAALAVTPRPCGSPPLDVLVFVLDDVAAADLALYGGPVRTPYLERLAAAGVTFDAAYANANCAATRRALQFGRWWLTGNGVECDDALTADTPTLAEVSLAEALAGHSSALIGKWHLGADPLGAPWECAPRTRGYDYWLAGVSGNVLGSAACRGTTYSDWLEAFAGPGACSSAQSALYHPKVVRDAFRTGWPAAPRPRLAVVCPNLAHAPFHRPPADLLPAGYPATVNVRMRFEAMITALDRTLGQMLARVDLATTLVVVVGDNGTPPDVAPDPARAKGTTFERGIRVPLVVAGGPTAGAGRRIADLVHVVDLYATVLDLTGGAPAGPGVSLRAALADAPRAPRGPVLCGSGWGQPGGDRAALTSDRFKLRQLDADGDGLHDAEELYDLVADPHETTDVLALHPSLAAALRAWIAAEAP